MNPPPRLLVYGATGYTGKLVAAEAAARGVDVVLGGRDPETLTAVAEPFGFETRSVSLSDGPRLRATLEDVAAVLHIAGPVSATARPMVEACLATGTHSLDVTGELDVFEALARRDEEARRAGIVLIPGVGFDVVPTDCLAAHAAKRVADPQRVLLAVAGIGGGVSRGTAKTMIEFIGRGLAIRRDGVITYRPNGSLTRDFDFGAGPVRAVGTASATSRPPSTRPAPRTSRPTSSRAAASRAGSGSPVSSRRSSAPGPSSPSSRAASTGTRPKVRTSRSDSARGPRSSPRSKAPGASGRVRRSRPRAPTRSRRTPPSRRSSRSRRKRRRPATTRQPPLSAPTSCSDSKAVCGATSTD